MCSTSRLEKLRYIKERCSLGISTHNIVIVVNEYFYINTVSNCTVYRPFESFSIGTKPVKDMDLSSRSQTVSITRNVDAFSR